LLNVTDFSFQSEETRANMILLDVFYHFLIGFATRHPESDKKHNISSSTPALMQKGYHFSELSSPKVNTNSPQQRKTLTLSDPSSRVNSSDVPDNYLRSSAVNLPLPAVRSTSDSSLSFSGQTYHPLSIQKPAPYNMNTSNTIFNSDSTVVNSFPAFNDLSRLNSGQSGNNAIGARTTSTLSSVSSYRSTASSASLASNNSFNYSQISGGGIGLRNVASQQSILSNREGSFYQSFPSDLLGNDPHPFDEALDLGIPDYSLQKKYDNSNNGVHTATSVYHNSGHPPKISISMSADSTSTQPYSSVPIDRLSPSAILHQQRGMNFSFDAEFTKLQSPHRQHSSLKDES
jgi:hypothetical protein